ncbi:MAG: energy transducer TonB [Terracidiphilus sp.]
MTAQPVQDLGGLSDTPEEAFLEPSDLNSIGDSIKAPILVQSAAAEFTDEARRGKHGGVCIVSFVVDRDGKPQDVRIVEKLGYGLDQKAIEAVKRYQFKPAIKDGRPIPVTLTTEVEFRIYR